MATPTLAGWKRLPGKSQRYQNVNTGKILSKRQYQKLKNQIKSKLEQPRKTRQPPKSPKYLFPTKAKAAPGRKALSGWERHGDSPIKLHYIFEYTKSWPFILEAQIAAAMGRGADTFSVLIRLKDGEVRAVTGEYWLPRPDLIPRYVELVAERLEEYMASYPEEGFDDLILVGLSRRDQDVYRAYAETLREFHKQVKPKATRRRVA